MPDALARLADAAEIDAGEQRLPADLVRARLAAGVPLIDRLDLPIPASVGRLFEQLTEALLPDPRAQHMLDALRSHRLHAEQLVGEAIVGHAEHLEVLAASAGVSATLVRSLADLAARPLLEAIARRLRPALALGAWNRDYCPICGGLPLRGDLDPDTLPGEAARLHCGRCSTLWAYGLQERSGQHAARSARPGDIGYRLEHGDPGVEGFDDD